MKIAIGSDLPGKPLLDVIKVHLQSRADTEVVDLTAQGTYADSAVAVAHAVVGGEVERGILFCGTGIGISMAANKIAGIRATIVHDTYSAERSAKSNNANIIALGARVVGPELAKAVVDKWLSSHFDPEGPSAANVRALMELDAKTRSDR